MGIMAVRRQKKKFMLIILGDFTLTEHSDNHLFLTSAQLPPQLREDYKNWVASHLGILALLTFLLIKFA